MGTYTPNYNLYMPSIGEQGWGNLVSNNFEILDTILNTINTNIGNGTRVLSISSSPSITINTSNFNNYAFYDENNVYTAQFYGNTTFSSIPQPSHSCRLMIIVVNGDATISGNINTYPTSLQTETPPNTPTNNIYRKEIIFNNFNSCTLTYTANGNNSQLTMDYNDYLTFLGKHYILSIPHAIAAGGDGVRAINGTAGTATNTCNGGGGGGSNTNHNIPYYGGTGCIFGQYSGGNITTHENGYGYGDVANNKYRCALIFVVNGNLIINSTITQNGGNGGNGYGGYGGGAYGRIEGNGGNGGGGGAPVFIYYTGSYVNNGTINVNGGIGYGASYSSGGAGGIKTTKITI